MSKNYDFSGWATRNDVLCADGRRIRQGAFSKQNGKRVPLIWNHEHGDPNMVLGHAILEDRPEGVYAYCSFNNTENGKAARETVKHRDVGSLSIWANHLTQDGGDVLHGTIREVSLVLAGANPEARIDSYVSHSGFDPDGDEAEIYTAGGFSLDLIHGEGEDDMNEFEELEEPEDTEEADYELDEEEMEALAEEMLAEEGSEEDDEDGDEIEHSDGMRPIEDIIGEMTDEQQTAVYALVKAVENQQQELEHSDMEEMEMNVFENDEYVKHSAIDFKDMLSDAKRIGSLKEAYLQHCEAAGVSEDELMHADEPERYGIMPKLDPTSGEPVPGSLGIDALFPEYRNLNNPPEWIKRNMAWVSVVMGGVHHTPFSRIKSMFADLTEDDARAKGYMKGNLKKEQVFSLLKRTTDPQTIYKKQKLDRDDVIDITDFDVVAWIKAEMREMLDEEIARAILVGDGRLTSSDDKIFENHVRSIYNDDDFYSNKVAVKVPAAASDDAIAKATIRAIIKARKDYKGSGNPVFFTTADVLTDMLLLEDANGRIIYDTEEKLRTALRVSRIVEVEVMEGLTRTDSNNVTRPLIGIIVNLSDYNVGADKGGAVAMFDDFDIDYNQMKYLIETRMSGALIKPHSAMVVELEKAVASNNQG